MKGTDDLGMWGRASNQHSSVPYLVTCMGELSLCSPSSDNYVMRCSCWSTTFFKLMGDPNHPDNRNLMNILKKRCVSGLGNTYDTLELTCNLALQGARAQAKSQNWTLWVGDSESWSPLLYVKEGIRDRSTQSWSQSEIWGFVYFRTLGGENLG